MRLRKNMKRTAAAALALSMAVSTAAVPASAGYTIDMSDAKITGDVEIRQDADGSGTKITISVDGQDKTKDFSDGKEDDKITITGDNTVTKSAATTTAAADAAKDDTKAPETTVTENKDGTVISYTGELDAQPDQEVSRPDSQNDQNDPEADQKNQGDQADQNDPEADQKNQGDQGDQGDPEADQKNQSDPEADQSGQKNQNKDSEDADAGIMTYEAPAPTTLTSAVAAAVRNVIKIINNVAGAENALNITLNNAKIESDSKAAMKISGEGDVNIELNHSNVLTSGGHHAGLEKNDKDSSGRLTIRDDLRNNGTAKTDEEKKAEEDAVAAGETTGDAVEDVGSLTATATGGSSGGAGIGGGAEGYYDTKDTSSIVIDGGKITATGGEGATGIGGGYWGDGGKVNRKDPDDRSQTITINGGNIEATGIGGSSLYNGGGDGAVTITGGHIQSTAEYGAGIGGGWSDDYGGDGDVLITGGVIEAEGLRGAGIGGGGADNDDTGNYDGCLGGDAKVEIRGKNTIIKKAVGHLGAGIGGGSTFVAAPGSLLYDGGSAEIEITDGATVQEAVGGEGGAGIGSGAGRGNQSDKTYAHVTIKNATVESAKSGLPSKGKVYGAGIGGGGTKGEYWNGENVIRIINSVIGRFKLDANGNHEKDANGNYLLDTGAGALGTHGSEGIGRGANESEKLSGDFYGEYGNNDVIIDNSWVSEGNTMEQKFNHDWHYTETLPTCTKDGEKVGVCSRCGMKKTEKISALGHEWGDWTVTTPATCTNEGVETRICNRDPSHVETRTIPTTGHNWVDNGNGTHTCTNCGATEAFGALELRVVDAEGMNKPFTVSQNGTLRTYTGAYDTATLTGDLNTLRYLQDHGTQTIQFVTNGQTSSFDINDLLAQGSGNEVFYLTHRGAEEPTLLLVEADHSELVKD